MALRSSDSALLLACMSSEHQVARAGEMNRRFHTRGAEISPIRITSGAARTTPRSARA